MEDIVFPPTYWQGWDSHVTFLPGDILPEESEGRLYAVLVFVFYGDKIALADIAGRGMCIPSGRIENGETIDESAVRECFEEVGAQLIEGRRRLLGCYCMVPAHSPENTVAKYCPVFVAEAAGFVSLPPGTESQGMFLAAMEDVAEQYFFWDDLLSSVFNHAQQMRDLWWPAGQSISEFMEGR